MPANKVFAFEANNDYIALNYEAKRRLNRYDPINPCLEVV
jgi:hypothetical protein